MADSTTTQDPQTVLATVQETCEELIKVLDTNLQDGFIEQAIKQHLKGASDGVNQILRNMILEAEVERKKAEGILK